MKIVLVGEPGHGKAAHIVEHLHQVKCTDNSQPAFAEPALVIKAPLIKTYKYFTPPETRAERRKNQRKNKKNR